ncbi:MFS general substrate transporter [Polychaeton citri CBS 116435]|uniref:MFS general substrate transporter n=1 Tax=Polychaeton citri CBS 116435 TaxID=1314669 RepID=A0A9P4Q2E0_9PEZI|nr:MFS general substrate transporter [Polychaeton citri CBS 116435]
MPAFIERFGSVGPDGVPYLTATQTSVITATRTSASIPAIFVCAYLGTKWGRKRTNWVGCLTCLIGTALQTGATNIPMITVGLTVANFGYFIMVSMSSTLAIEIAPVPIRGIVGSMSVVGTGVAAVMSSGIGWGTSHYNSDMAFRIPLGIQNVWPAVMAILMLFVMDSPTTYLINGNDEGAEKSLRLVRNGYTNEEIMQELEELKVQSQLRKADNDVKWVEIFRGPNLRRTMLASFLGIIQQFSGSIYATSYATTFLAAIGSADPFLLVFALNILILGGSVTGLFLVDNIGRRLLMLVSFGSLLIIDICMGGLGFADSTNLRVIKAMSALSLIFGFFYASTMGPLTWLNAAELPTARLRTITNASVLLSNSLTNLLVTYIVPFIANADAGDLGPKTYLIFAGFMFAGFIIAYIWFPDSTRRSAAELDHMFEAGLSARKFGSWRSDTLTHSDVEEGGMGSGYGYTYMSHTHIHT